MYCKVYSQAEQEAIVNARNEAAAKEIAKIKNNTQAALAKLVNFTFKRLLRPVEFEMHFNMYVIVYSFTAFVLASPESVIGSQET